MSSHQLTIVQLDLVNSSQSFKDLFEKYDLENEILRAFIRKIEAIVKPAFDKSTNTYNIDSNLTKIEMAMADGYRLIFQFPQNAYEFVQIFCELVNERNQKPGIDQWMFRFGAATDPDINYDPEAINKFTGYGFLKAKELEAGAFPGWLFVDKMTYSKLSQDIQNKFSKQSFKNKHNESREAYGYPMLANYVQPIKPIIWTVEPLRGKTIIPNANNIVDYLFVIVKPQTNQKFYIEAQLARFINNQTKQKKDDYEIPIQIQQPEDGCEKKHIIGVLDKIIKEMYKITELSKLPIIELFLPIDLLSEDFDNREITDEWNDKTPIGKLYPVIIRSYDRFLHNDENKARLKLAWQQQWESLEKKINDNNTEQFINIIKNNDTTYVRFIDDPLPTRKNKRIKLFQAILSTGFPLCLWTRYKDIDKSSQINDYLERILKIDDNHYPGYCKFYKILINIHDIRKKDMTDKEDEGKGDKGDFGYNLGVLFDHDKIPTAANQLISPNMARKV
ncbi:MAG: hypothetical protein WBA52_17325 [Dolichospermum sp.]